MPAFPIAMPPRSAFLRWLPWRVPRLVFTPPPAPPSCVEPGLDLAYPPSRRGQRHMRYARISWW